MMPVVSVFLAISILSITITAPLAGPNDAIEYLKPRLKGNDVIVASDDQIYSFFFRTNPIYPASAENILTKNASYVILKADFHQNWNNNMTCWFNAHYTEAHRTPSPMGEPVFIIFEKR